MTDPFDAAAAAGHQLQQQLAQTQQALAAETAQEQGDESKIAALQQQVADLQAQLDASAPFFVGVATTNQDRTQLAQRETYVRRKLAFRQYENAGIGDYAVPGGNLAKRILQDKNEGRPSVVSGKPGIQALANHQYHDELVAHFRWAHSLGVDLIEIVHHEPENDGRPPAEFVESQRFVRSCLDEAAGGQPTKVQFWGCLMTYSWTAPGITKHGQPDAWNPGLMPDGCHVWDACGLDHYEPSLTATTLISAKWKSALASLQQWGVTPAILELGVKGGNPNGGRMLTNFYAALPLALPDQRMGGVFYYDSHGGPSATSDPDQMWDLVDRNGSLPAFKEFALAH
jgi:hypothetical protein